MSLKRKVPLLFKYCGRLHNSPQKISRSQSLEPVNASLHGRKNFTNMIKTYRSSLNVITMPLQKGGRERCDGGRGEGNVMVEARGWREGLTQRM